MAQQDDVPATGRSWDVALGAALSHGPDFAGAQGRQMSLTPGLYLRYGRLSLASRSAFVVRSSDPGTAGGGLRLDLSRSDALRIGLGLRNESGRRESSSPELRGMGDLPRSLRLRLAARWALPEDWRLSSSLSVDALGRGGGWLGELSLSRELPLTPHTSWGGNAALTLADRRHLQSRFGVTPEQAARSGHATYTPGSGLREMSLSAGIRSRLSPSWTAFGGVSLSRLLGPARRSPLTREPQGLGLSAGLVFSF